MYRQQVNQHHIQKEEKMSQPSSGRNPLVFIVLLPVFQRSSNMFGQLEALADQEEDFIQSIIL